MRNDFSLVFFSRRVNGTGWTRWGPAVDAAEVARLRREGNNTDVYTTLQRYEERIWNPAKPLACLQPLAFDTDDSNDLAHSLTDARRLVEHLIARFDLPPAAVRVHFTGNRGLHVTVHPRALGIAPSADLPRIIKLMALEIIERLDLASADRSIYGIRRQWRLPDSRHSKTSLFKVELSHEELFRLDPDAIRALARAPRGPLYGADDLDFTPSEEGAAVFAHWRDAHRAMALEERPALTAGELQELIGEADPPCIKHLLLHSVPAVGLANKTLLTLSSYWKGRGVPEKDALARLQAFAQAIPDSRFSQSRSERERNAGAASVNRSVYDHASQYGFRPNVARGLLGDCPAPGECSICPKTCGKPKVGIVPTEKLPPAQMVDYLPLSAARARLANHIRQVLHQQARRLNLLTGGPGSGKTQQAVNALGDLADTHDWPINQRGRPVRVAFLADNALQLEEVLGKLPPSLVPMVGVLRGRSADESSPFYCAHAHLTEAVGKRRHVPAVDVCLHCPDAAWCEEEGYGHAVKKALGAQVVLAPKAALLSDHTERLKGISTLIADEALLPFLLENLTITDRDVAGWQEAMAEVAKRTPGSYHPEHPLAVLLGLVRQALARTRARGDNRLRLMPELRRVAADAGVDLPGLLDSALAVPVYDSKRHRYDFEMPGRPWEATWKGAPLRATRDLVEALWNERHRGPEADTRCWLVRQEDGQAAIELVLVRQKLLRALRHRTVVNLDSTPSPLLRSDFLGMEVTTYDTPVRQALRIVQFVDGRFTLASLKGRNGAVAKRLSQGITAALQELGAKSTQPQPAVFTFKAMRPDLPDSEGKITLQPDYPGIKWGHFGGSERGLDAYAGCDAMLIVGAYCDNIGALETQVEALRFAKAPPRGERTEARALYEGYRDPSDGQGRDFPIKVHGDPDVQAVIEHSMASTIIQTAGRLRAACREREDGRPFPVVIFSSQPFRGLPVHGLQTLDDLLARSRSRFEQARDAKNRQRWEEAEQRLGEARTLGFTGTRALARATGLSVHTVIAHEQQRAAQQGDAKALHTGVYYINRQQPATPSSSPSCPPDAGGGPPAGAQARRPYAKPGVISMPLSGAPAFIRTLGASTPMAAALRDLVAAPTGGAR